MTGLFLLDARRGVGQQIGFEIVKIVGINERV
jgi:hypothetical protein